MVARAPLILPVAMTAWVAPLPITDAAAPGPPGAADSLRGAGSFGGYDAIASASLLGYGRPSCPAAWICSSRWPMLRRRVSAGGFRRAAWARRRPCWSPPAACCCSGCASLPGTPGGDDRRHRRSGRHRPRPEPSHYLDAATHLLSGGALLGAFFIATDYVTSPQHPAGR